LQGRDATAVMDDFAFKALQPFAPSVLPQTTVRRFAAFCGDGRRGTLRPAGCGFAGAEADLARTFSCDGGGNVGCMILSKKRVKVTGAAQGCQGRRWAGAGVVGRRGRKPPAGQRNRAIIGRKQPFYCVVPAQPPWRATMGCKKPPANPPPPAYRIKPLDNRSEILKLFSLTGMILPVYRKPTGRLKIPALLLGC